MPAHEEFSRSATQFGVLLEFVRFRYRTRFLSMVPITFDTLKFTKRLEAAGVAPEHAEAIAEAFSEATGTELVTKDFLKQRFSREFKRHNDIAHIPQA